MDRFKVEVISQTPNPQQVIYLALHQDYTDGFVADERESWPDEDRCGEIIVKRLLSGDRGHYGPLEHPQIVFNCGYFPHSVMQQARTHRVGISFDVQCLARDTKVTLVTDLGDLQWVKIAEIYEQWNRDKNLVSLMKVRTLNEETGIFETGKINQVFSQGIQPVYRLKTEDGKTLDCTENHRLLTQEGWKIMKDGLGLITDTNGQVIDYQSDCYLMSNGVTIFPDIRGDESEITDSDLNIFPQKAHPIRVVEVEYLGLQKTYDLEIEGRWHNFVANGIVVHNSFRYTGHQFLEVAQGKKDIESVFYLRPVGYYSDRQGKKYHYSPEQRAEDLQWCLEAVKGYERDINRGMSEEHARGKLPFDYRQHFVVSFNLRSFLHFCDLRHKKDAQLEIQKLCELMWPHFRIWAPEIAKWYEQSRLGKARLSP